MAALSQDIRADLEKACSQKFDFDGSYAFSKTYQKIPFPGLTVKDLGRIHLPLDANDATRIISVASQAPFGHGEKTVIDKKVRDTWEIEATDISFANPAWSNWLQTDVLPNVYQELGLTKGSAPRCELYKLLLYEEGSHFLAHQDTEKSPGMFATMVIILPSPFTGGAVEVSHAGSQRSLDVAEKSEFSTSVLAWYTDVMHEVKPITSGYRLALSYNLIHSQTQPIQNYLQSLTVAHNQFHHVLTSWKQNAESSSESSPKAPNKLAILLDHQYSPAEFSRNSFKGSDAAKLSHLLPAAESLGFEVHFADFEYHIEGCGDDEGYDRRHSYYGRSDEDVGMLEVNDRTLTIGDLKDKDGEVVYDNPDDKLSIDANNEMIPKNGVKKLEGTKPDEQEYEGYMGNGAGSLEHWYRRMLLIIWPKSRSFSILLELGPENLESNLEEFAETAERDNAEDQKTFQSLMQVYHDPHIDPFVWSKHLMQVAIEWGDLQKWIDVAKVSVADEILSMMAENPDLFFDAYEAFSFEEIKPHLEALLNQAKQDHARLSSVSAIADMVADDDETVRTWCADWLKKLSNSLRSLQTDDVEILMELASKNGGVNFVRNTIIPQIATLACGKGFLLQFVSALHRGGTTFAPEDQIGLKDIENTLLTRGIKEATLVDVVTSNHYMGPRESTVLSISEIGAYLSACFETADMGALSCLFDRLFVVKTTHTPSQRAAEILVPLVHSLDRLGKEHKVSLDQKPIVDFCIKVTADYIDSFDIHTGARQADVFLPLALRCGGMSYLQKIATPSLKKRTRPTSFLDRLARLVHSHKVSPEMSASDGEDLRQAVVRDIVTLAVSKSNYSDDTTSLILLCVQTDNPDVSKPILDRIKSNFRLPHPDTQHTQVTKLSAMLIKTKTAASAEPFRSFYQQFMDGYLKLLGPRPQSPPAIPTWSCSFSPYCTSLMTFLKGPGGVLHIGDVAAVRNHVEKNHLQTHNIRRFATWETIKGRPYNLVVMKSAVLTGLLDWQGKLQAGKSLLDGIGGAVVLREVFGDGCDAMIAAFNGDVSCWLQRLSAPAIQPASNSKQSSVPWTSMPPLPSGSLGSTSGTGAPSRIHARSPDPSDLAPNKKKRKNVIAGPVIDLTTP